MTSKERVLVALSHRTPDRVPIGEWGIDHDHVSRILGRHTYWRNWKDETLGYWTGRRDEVVESQIRDYAELIEAMDYDIIPVRLVPPRGYKPADPPRQVEEGVWKTSAGDVYKYAASNDSIVAMTYPPARDTLDESSIRAWLDPALAFDESQFELVDAMVKRFGKDRAIVFRGISAYEPLFSLFGGDEIHRLTIPLLVPEEVEKMQEPVFQYNKSLIDRLVARGVPFVMQGDDLGDSRSCILPPPSLRRLYFPVLKRIADHAKARGAHIFFHCCGNVWEVMDDFVNAGMEAYQSIQSTAGMDLKRVKQLYGDRLALWAGIQCETLVGGSLAAVEDEVKRSLDICMPGGGFFFGSTNSVQYGAKTQNYLRALELVRQRGKYS